MSSPNLNISQAIGLFAIALGIEIAFCAAIILFAIPLNVARLSLWILWIAMAIVAWHRFSRSRISLANTTSSTREYLIYICLVACYAGASSAIVHFGFEAFRISSGAMKPTIFIGAI